MSIRPRSSPFAALLAAIASLLPTAANAADFPLQRWLDEPDVKLVAVEFYADWCKPCKESAPKWEALRRGYAAQGLKLVVVNVTEKAAGDKRCSGLPWNPDVSLCDPAIGERLGVKGLPEAFVWSWQGNLLVERGQHVDKIEQIIKRYLDDNPRVQVEATDLKGKPDAALRRAVESALGRSGKLTVVPDVEMQARLKAMRKASHRAAGRDDQRCPLGAEVSANSLLRVERFDGSLSLKVLDAVSGCQRATANVPWDARGAGRTADKAVYSLLQRLKRSQVQLPAGMAGRRAAVVAETDKRDTGAGDWTPESEDLAMVSFASEPTGAMVLVDNKPLCQTPCTKGLSPGSHRVTMHMPEYVSRDESVALVAGKKLNWQLAADFALLTVTTEPVGVAVTVDGKTASAGVAVRVSPGRHELVAKDRCHASHRKGVVLKRGEERHVVLRPVVRPAGLMVMVSDAKGNDLEDAEIWVDGRRLGRAFTAVRVSACVRNVEVRHPQHGRTPVEVQLVERKTSTVRVTAIPANKGALLGRRPVTRTVAAATPALAPSHPNGTEAARQERGISHALGLSVGFAGGTGIAYRYYGNSIVIQAATWFWRADSGDSMMFWGGLSAAHHPLVWRNNDPGRWLPATWGLRLVGGGSYLFDRSLIDQIGSSEQVDPQCQDNVEAGSFCATKESTRTSSHHLASGGLGVGFEFGAILQQGFSLAIDVALTAIMVKNADDWALDRVWPLPSVALMYSW